MEAAARLQKSDGNSSVGNARHWSASYYRLRRFPLRVAQLVFRLIRTVLYKTSSKPMKSRKYSSLAAFFRRTTESVTGRKVTETGAEKAARVSKETGVSVRALSLFSKIAEDKSYTADAAHKDFGHIKRKKVA